MERVKPHILADDCKLMYPPGSRPGVIYAMAKVHKSGKALRPVASMIGAPQYGLAYYLDKIIKLCTPNEHSTDFIHRLCMLMFSLTLYDGIR